MTMQLDSAPEPLVRYVGLDRYALLWLPGWTVEAGTAQAAVRAAEAVQQKPATDDQVWQVVREGASALGLTLREFAQSIAPDVAIPPEPSVPDGNPVRRRWLRGGK